jgi:prepilin-type N-terminal cleavage/methylation domain-containing protein
MVKISKKRLGGFTLIELLVVIAIIGVLSSIVLAAVGSARKKAQLVVAAQEIHQLQNAMEMYKLKTGKAIQGIWWASETDSSFKTALNPLVSLGLMPSIPSSPFPIDNVNGHGLSFGYISRDAMPSNNVYGCGKEQIVESYIFMADDLQVEYGSDNIEYDLKNSLPHPYLSADGIIWSKIDSIWCLGD